MTDEARAEEASEEFFEVVTDMARSVVAGVKVGCPATVWSYDKDTNAAKVQPVVMARQDGGRPIKGPMLVNVPVAWPQFGRYSITGQLAKGDQVWLWFSDRSLDEWKALGGTEVEARDKRRFSINDAVAYPGISPFKGGLTNQKTDGLVIGQDQGRGATEPLLRIVITDTGISIGNGAVDLLSLLDQLISALSSGFFGPWPMSPTTQAQLLAIQGDLALIREP